MSLYRLAASIAAEENGSSTNNTSIPTGLFPFEEDDGDEEEEMILVSVLLA